MASGTTFSLAILVLASIYRGLNGITKAVKPSHSRLFFSYHYLHGWLAHYFKTHHVLQPPPLSPLMVRYSELQMTHSDIGDARELIHEGRISGLGCLMLNRIARIGSTDSLGSARGFAECSLSILAPGWCPMMTPFYIGSDSYSWGLCLRALFFIAP